MGFIQTVGAKTIAFLQGLGAHVLFVLAVLALDFILTAFMFA